ncbi:hypothetical protein [Tessaracoccus coleopterorum]|uniref:hypothetical protein n=1 Tax=Tessaracoccus coleopterorum TaxID=2714950 RepID=UPI0018D46559|nr:hypothetical protein [Tessaracoccus coleopterorum]
MNAATEAIRTARDQLLASAGRASGRDVSSPGLPSPALQLGHRLVRRGGPRQPDTALWLRDLGGRDTRYSYDDMVRRSDRLAGWLEGLGIGKGDPSC